MAAIPDQASPQFKKNEGMSYVEEGEILSKELSTKEGFVSGISLKEGDEALTMIKELGYTPENFHELASKFDEAYYKRLTRKIDYSILPFIMLAYMFQFLDKSLLNYGAVMGLIQDTGLHGKQYGSIAASFSYGQLAWQFPTIWLAQKYGKIGTYLGLNLIAWGICLGATAACNTFGGLFATRFLLGCFEACVAPINTLIVAMWYAKYSQGRRIMMFYVNNGLTQIWGGAIAYALSGTNLKFAPWRILYLLFGCLTVFTGILMVIFLPNSPVQARWFTKEERIAVLLRVKENQSGTQNKTWKARQALEIFTDPKTALNLFLVVTLTIPNGAFANFSSILIKSFGYTSRQSILLQMPAGAIAAICTIAVGVGGDLTGERSLMIVACLIPAIVGAAILVAKQHPKGILLLAIYLTGPWGPTYAAQLAWNASNVAGYSKKTAMYAMTQGLFAVGNIAGSYTLPPSSAPRYLPAKATILACMSISLVAAIVLRFVCSYYNRKHAKLVSEIDPAIVEKERERYAFSDETDLRNPFFQYTR